jgi:hypothetical protein
MKSGDRFDVVSYGQFTGAQGEPWASWTTADGQYAAPMAYVARVEYDPPLEGGFGFA